MLFKRDTNTAREARLGPEAVGQGAALVQAERDAPLSPAPPSREQLEIRRLSDESSALRQELALLHKDWDSALAEAETRARETAALQHMANDSATLAALREGMAAARKTFDDALQAGLESTAHGLAVEALARLVIPVANEDAWLTRSIQRRLGELRRQAVVSLRVPDGLDPALIAGLRAELPAEATIETDPALKSGTARIVLRLGRIEIDPSRGLQEALALIAESDNHE
jgi:hypothetical protein